MSGLVFRVSGFGFRALGPEFRVHVEDLGFRLKGFRVYGRPVQSSAAHPGAGAIKVVLQRSLFHAQALLRVWGLSMVLGLSRV